MNEVSTRINAQRASDLLSLRRRLGRGWIVARRMYDLCVVEGDREKERVWDERDHPYCPKPDSLWIRSTATARSRCQQADGAHQTLLLDAVWMDCSLGRLDPGAYLGWSDRPLSVFETPRTRLAYRSECIFSVPFESRDPAH